MFSKISVAAVLMMTLSQAVDVERRSKGSKSQISATIDETETTEPTTKTRRSRKQKKASKVQTDKTIAPKTIHTTVPTVYNCTTLAVKEDL